MFMRINNNIVAMNTHRQLGLGASNGSKATEKLSSGFRINRAGDDAAGLAISEKMRGQIRGLAQASRNAQDGISMIQTAEGALQESHAILQRMRELAVQASNDTNVENDRNEIQNEIDELTTEIDRIGNTTEFNTQKLLNVSGSGFSATFQVGSNQSQTFTINILDMRSDALDVKGSGTRASATATVSGVELTAVSSGDAGNDIKVVFAAGESGASAHTVAVSGDTITVGLKMSGSSIKVADNTLSGVIAAINGNAAAAAKVTASIATGSSGGDTVAAAVSGTLAGGNNGTLSVATSSGANEAIKRIDDAITAVSSQRSSLGAWQNRLDHTIKNLDTSAENLQAAESRIRDVDMAKEMMNFTKNNILQQAAQAMLAQANQAPQGVLQLLR
jgi:flagellin